MNTIPNEPTCPKCGKPVSFHAFEGLCPECLMQAGFGPATGSQGGEKIGAFVPPAPEELARHFPQLEILELLGRGGMGAVYKARQTHLERIVALKILPPSVSRAPSFAERFVREAKALAKLHHPNIVTLYESGQADELFYFLMEFVDGVNLRQLLAAGTISPRDALAIVPQICDALQFAHDRGIVHRDIKPENILLNKAGQVKIADFGVAKLVAGEIPESPSPEAAGPLGTQTEVGKVVGTPQYMAPEQISHPLDVDNRADIYALGVVFYQMLTGELPAGKFEPPSSKVQIDVRLDEVVLRALAKRPELRYQQASVLKTQVETIAATPGGAGIPAQTRPARAPIPPYRILASVLRWMGVALAVVVLTILGGLYLTDKILPKIYVASAQIQVLPRLASSPAGADSNPEQANLDEIEIIQSPDVLLPVIKDLNLGKAWATRADKSRSDALSPQEALAYLNKNLKLDFRFRTTIIDITVSSVVPKEAADIANSIADRCKVISDVEADQRNSRDQNSLRAQISQQEKVVGEKKRIMDAAQLDLAQKGIIFSPSTGDPFETELDESKTALRHAQADYDARQRLVDMIIKLPDDEFLNTLDGLQRGQPDIKALRADIFQMQTDITNLLNDGFSEGHPRIVSMKAEIKAKQGQLADLVAGLRCAMEVDLDMAKSRVPLLQKQLDDQQEKFNGQSALLQPFRDAQHEYDRQRTLLDTLNTRLNQLVADSQGQESSVRIIARAVPPKYPASPNRALIFFISMAAGIFLGVVLASIVEFMMWRRPRG
jgi:serine/threonine protein kinase